MADYRDAQDEIEALRQELDQAKADRYRVHALLQTARVATRRVTAVLVANAGRLDTPFTNDPGSPWTLHVSPAVNRLRQGLGMHGAWPVGCTCEFHGRTCEAPSELCCENCSESQHPNHLDGSACSAPDLSGNHMPTAVEMALRAELDRLRDERAPVDDERLREAALHVIQVARYGNVLDTGTAIAALRRVLDGGT